MSNNYNFEHLILLVGTNPLPNYVVAKYFLINNHNLKNVWLVYSEKQNDDFGTKEIAERIRDVLNKEYQKNNEFFKFCPVEDISNAKKIKSNIETNILEKINKNVHLNYTGGTKAMAVHVYRAIERWDKINNKSFSYLDARKFKLIDDDEIITDDLRKSINISFDHLIELHGYKKKEEGFKYSGEWENVLFEFEKLIADSKLKDYFDWKKQIIRTIYYNEKDKIDDKVKTARSRIKDNSNKFNDNYFKEKALNLLGKIPSEHSILYKNKNLWIPEENVSNTNYGKRIKPAIEFLDGKWLENYIGIVLKKDMKNIPIQLNWKLEKQNIVKDFKIKDFELDILLVNGYQINGISCTTSQKEEECKLKGFEILHRVSQIGGEEARAILITCLTHNGEKGDQIKIMEEDLKSETGSSEKLLVLGIEDLKKDKLLDKIKKHVEIQETA